MRATRQSRDLVAACPDLPTLQRNLLFELGFLRAVIAWEAFIEDVFITYLLHRPTRSGRVLPSRMPSRSVNRAGGTGGVTIRLAGEILIGDRRFVDWFSESEVKARAAKWFPGDTTFGDTFACFADPLGRNGVRPFDDIKIVRNRIAHSSGNAADRFATLRAREVANVDERMGMGPGQFLRRSHDSAGGVTWFEVYHSLMEQAAAILTQ